MAFASFQTLTAADLNSACFPDICIVGNSVSVSIPHASTTTLNADTELLDPNGLHSTATNTSRITVAKAGIYRIAAHVKFTTNGTGVRAVDVLKNGGFYTNQVINATNGGETDIMLLTWASLVANDFVSVGAHQASGGNLNVQLRTFSVELIPT